MDANVEKVSELHDRLAEKGVKFVRILWAAASNIHRVRVVPLGRFFDSVLQNGICIASAVLGVRLI